MLSGPHQKFAEGIAAGLNQTAAYQAAYPKATYDAAKSKAVGLVTKDNVIAEIKRLRERATKKFSMSHAQWLERFVTVAEKAEEKGDLATVRALLREIGLANGGWYPAAKVDVTTSAEVKIVIGQ